ncbi:MAG: hypothetical protein FJY29_02855 [Betaproteobacteria bacterium]|nr:hypothetical protein [Betaproteobacteria bacterium]
MCTKPLSLALQKVIAGVFLGFMLGGCTQKSGIKSISSDDWFRKGVDRFYLATVPSSRLHQGASTVKVGQDLLVGVGCFGEAKEPATLAPVMQQSCSSGKGKLPLNERIRLQDFLMAANPEKPQPGECVLLLGPKEVVQRVQEQPEEFVSGPAATAALSAATATNACGLSLAIGQSFYLQKAVVKGSVKSDKEAIDFARKLLNFFGENNLVPSLYTGEHPVYALKANESLQGKQPSEVAASEKIVVGQAVLPCSEFKSSIWDVLGIAAKKDGRKVFFRALAEADRRAAIRIRQSRFFAEFAIALQRGDLRTAAGIYNPIFAFEFNRNVDAKASQGWGGFGVQKFFDEIRAINKELSAL